MGVIKDNSGVWSTIPLSDYEAHMSHERVGQLQLQNDLLTKYLDLLMPSTLLYAGVAGGNGLEHVNPEITKEVFCLDINPEYLRVTGERFSERIPGLSLLCMDIRKNPLQICKADLIWASLLVEYTGIIGFVNFVQMNIRSRGDLVITIQADHGGHSISDTGIQSIKNLEACFQLVDPGSLKDDLSRNGFVWVGEEENFLSSGKSLRTFHFKEAR